MYPVQADLVCTMHAFPLKRVILCMLASRELHNLAGYAGTSKALSTWRTLRCAAD